jgi:hypothetical protein
LAQKNDKKKRRRYGSYFWIDPKTKLGYAKVQIPTDERTPKGKIKYKTIMKRADNLTDAEDRAQEIFDEHDLRGAAFLDGREMTFQKLADWYKREFVIPPVYVDGKKVDGMRTWENERNKIDRLCDYFGKYLIEEIDEFMLRRYKLKRLKEEVKFSTINRSFETMRAMLGTDSQCFSILCESSQPLTFSALDLIAVISPNKFITLFSVFSISNIFFHLRFFGNVFSDG